MRIQYLKIIQPADLLSHMFCEARGKGESRFLRDPERGDVPRVEGGGVTFFKGSKRGVKKYSVNRNENLQTPPPHKK